MHHDFANLQNLKDLVGFCREPGDCAVNTYFVCNNTMILQVVFGGLGITIFLLVC
jgi:hypothetical protein